MPIYEYKCQDCGALVEETQKMTDPPLTTCPRCGGRLERLISRSAFHLKGGGWYKDLYSSPKAQGGDQAGGSGGKKAGSSEGQGAGSSTSSSDASNGGGTASGSAASAGGSKE